MGWVDDLDGEVVGLDTAPLIFYIEEHAQYGPVLEPFFEAVAAGRITLVTSVITLLEVLVHPLRNEDDALASKYNDILLSSPNIQTVTVTPATAQIASELRAESQLKTPDALQLATALSYKAKAFLTNDRDFGDVDSIEVLKLRDIAKAFE